MKGTGKSFGAITIVSAIASHKGCALGIDLPVEATVRLEKGNFKKKHLLIFVFRKFFPIFLCHLILILKLILQYLLDVD